MARRERPRHPLTKATPHIPPVWTVKNKAIWKNQSKDDSNEIQEQWLSLLDTEIRTFHDEVQPSKKDSDLTQFIISILTESVSDLWPGSETKVFGSVAMGFTLPDSDIDLVILNTSLLRSYSHPLIELGDHLKKTFNRRIEVKKLLTEIRIPLLTVKFMGKSVDIVMHIETGPILAGVVLDWAVAYPQAKHLLLFLKQFLRKLNLHQPVRGHVGSYVLFQMVICLLQQVHPDPSSANSLGWLLCRFFEFYGFHFNFPRVGISLHSGGFYPKSVLRDQDDDERWKLAALDLVDPTVNIGESTFKMWQVREAFRYAYHLIREPTVQMLNCEHRPFMETIIPKVYRFCEEDLRMDMDETEVIRVSWRDKRPFKKRRFS